MFFSVFLPLETGYTDPPNNPGSNRKGTEGQFGPKVTHSSAPKEPKNGLKLLILAGAENLEKLRSFSKNSSSFAKNEDFIA